MAFYIDDKREFFNVPLDSMSALRQRQSSAKMGRGLLWVL